MPKAYMVVTYRAIKDPEALTAYAKIAAPAIEAAGGKFLVRGEPAKTYALGVSLRVVISQFDSVEQAIAAYESPGYKKALEALGEDAVERDMRIVEGLD
ncbi:MAG: DUF1330 domain-containing protein [Gammaproteobacteria bacterium]|nr:DUF1330 domain-containing protein [Gammaproteobacteria bacterium]